MAGGTINLLFRVSKDGKGLEDLSKGMDNAKGKMADMGKAAAALGHTMGGVNNTFGQMAKSFLSGGVWMFAAQGIMLLIDKWREYKNEAAEAAKEAARDFAESMAHAANAVTKKFEKIYNAIAKIGARFKEANILMSSIGDTASSVDIASEKDATRILLSKANDDNERDIIKANEQVAIAKIKLAQAERKAAQNVEEAGNDIKMADKKIDKAKEKVEQMYGFYVNALWVHNKVDLSSDDAEEEYNDTLKALRKAHDDLAAAEEDVAKFEEEKRAKETALRVARQKSLQEGIAATQAVKEAEFQLAETERKAAEARKKQTEEAGAKEREKLLKQYEREAEEADKTFMAQQREQLQEQLDADTEQKKKQLDKMLPELKSLDKNIDALTLSLKNAENGIKRGDRGRAADARHTNGLFGQYEYGGRANGGENYTDWQRAQRFAGRADRDAEKAARRDAAAQKRYDRLSEERSKGRRLSDRDKGFMRDWENYQDQKNGAAKARGQLEAAQQKRDKLQEQMKGLLQSIDKNIKEAIELG